MAEEKRRHRRKTFLWIALSLLGLGISGMLLVYFLWFKPSISKPLAETLSLPTNPVITLPVSQEELESTPEGGGRPQKRLSLLQLSRAKKPHRLLRNPTQVNQQINL